MTPDCRAEYLYHRLMRGDEPTGLSDYYDESIRPFIENSLPELPDNAYIFLSTKMGITASAEKVKQASQQRWEGYLQREIIDAFQYGDENALTKLKINLKDRESRTYGSSLLYYEYYEAKLALKLASYKEALEIDNALVESFGEAYNQFN